MKGAFWTAWDDFRGWLEGFLRAGRSLEQQVHSPQDKPFVQIEHIAIAVKAIDSNQRHIGIIHRNEQEKRLLLLHLGWHNQLTDEPLKSSYRWVEVRIPKRRARQLAARCRHISRSNGRHIPYGFSPPSASFDAQTARFLFGPTKTGLTCASFVLAVFEFARIQLIRYSTWPSRPDDVDWQQRVLVALQRSGADPTHVTAVRQEIGCARYRPEEVAGASAIWPPSARFAAARSAAEVIMKEIV